MTDQPPIEPFEPRPGAIDPAVRRLAEKRLKARREFKQHFTSYVIVMSALVAIWLVTGVSYFWPIWPMLGWGIGLAFHAMSLRDSRITEEQIAAEAARIEARRLPGCDKGHREMPRLDEPQDAV